MLRVSDAVREIISNNTLLNFGFHHKLLNLSQVARFIRPLVEARTHKEVQDSAVLMNLSRMLREPEHQTDELDDAFFVDKINIHSGLCSLTIHKTRATHRELNQIFAKIQEQHGFITITEGISEITTILEVVNLEMALAALSDKPRTLHRNLASVGVKFSERCLTIHGVLYRLLQQVALQNINVIEVSSTATEFNIYVDENDVQLAFDSIYARFAKRSRRTAF